MPIEFPEGFDPERAPFHALAERAVAAPCERVWGWLVRAPLWPSLGAACRNLEIEAGPPDVLAAGSVLRWTAFGVRLRAVVEECEAPERLAWSATGRGLRAWHGWRIEPRRAGCRVVSEQVQYGGWPAVTRLWLGRRMLRAHEAFVDGLAAAAQRADPPRVR